MGAATARADRGPRTAGAAAARARSAAGPARAGLPRSRCGGRPRPAAGCPAPGVGDVLPGAHQPTPQPHPLPAVGRQQGEIADDARAEHQHVPPTAPGRASVVSGTQNSTSSGSPAMAGRRSRTAVRSVATATMPIPAAARSSMPRLAGTGGASPHLGDRPVEQADQVVQRGGGRQHAGRVGGGEHRVEIEELRGERGQEADDRGDRPPPGRAPIAATTMTAPAPAQNQSRRPAAGTGQSMPARSRRPRPR